jgi:TetR/AcrR family transcriptional regulator, transcriptional repressor for nem operon
VTAEPVAAGGTRLTNKGLATRARIVEAAAVLMHERGVHAVSLIDVRAAAAVSGSQMSHYFTDKRSLLRAVIRWQADSVVAFHTQPRLAGLDSIDALTAWADLVVEGQPERGVRGGCRYGSLAAELAETDDETRSDLREGYDRWAAEIRAGLQAMYDRGDLRPDADPDALTTSLIAAHQGGFLLAQVQRDPAPLRAALDGAIDHVRCHLVAEPAEPRSEALPR